MMKLNSMDMFLFALIVISISLIVYSVYNLAFFGNSYQKAIQSENSQNICATPPGYTDEQWREHMSHHPDRYAQCL